MEPTTITVNGRTTTAFIKYSDCTTCPTVYFNSSTTLSSFVGGRLQIPTSPTLFQYSGDPYLAADTNNDGYGPNRVYISGSLINPGAQNDKSGIAVWRSNDSGANFPTLPTVVAFDDSGTVAFYDKPTITVSSHAGSLGYVYVAYLVIDHLNAKAGSVWVARSTDGGASFPQKVEVPATVTAAGKVGGPQVVVSPGGIVYVLWADYLNGAIKLASSSNCGVSWSGALPGISGRNFYFGTNLLAGMRVFAIPSARYNVPAGGVSVVWHEKNAMGNADVYYAFEVNGLWWSAPVRINQTVVNDQFMPALHVDGSGNVAISYYDTRDDPVFARRYATYYDVINAYGSVFLQGDVRLSPWLSDPATLPLVNFIGDYHDMWYTNGSWHDVSTLVPSSGWSDIFLQIP